MKKTKLVLAGISILICVLLTMAQYKSEYSSPKTNCIGQDSTMQLNSGVDLPVLTIGLPVNF